MPGGVHRLPGHPITDGTVPGNVGQIFGTPGGAAGGPCIIEPQDNSLFPNNWLRPRFRFTAGQGLYEIRVHAANQANDLVVYTSNTTWTMPKPMWQALALHTRDMPITVSVRGAAPTGGSVSIGVDDALHHRARRRERQDGLLVDVGVDVLQRPADGQRDPPQGLLGR